MSLDGFRVPLQEQKGGINTPLPMKNGQKSVTTPPESVVAMRKKSLSMETPIKTFDPLESQSHHKNHLLLSPAFSSPQNHIKSNVIIPSDTQNRPLTLPGSQQSYPHSQFNSSPPPSAAPAPSHAHTTLSSFDDEFDDDKPKKKRKKEKKVFDIQSSDKPPYSYATLIGMSILSNPDKRLTLSSIYQWISDTFKYYKREDVGWQNSIRHNLSLNKAFIKGEKSKDGKGHYWCIEAGSEDQFLKLKNNKKSSYHEIMDQINSQSNRSSHDGTNGNGTGMVLINSIPSSPNYYDHNDSINTFNKFSDMPAGIDYGNHHDTDHDHNGVSHGDLDDGQGNQNHPHDDDDGSFDESTSDDDDLDFTSGKNNNNNKNSNNGSNNNNNKGNNSHTHTNSHKTQHSQTGLGAPFNHSWNSTPRPFSSFNNNHHSNSSGSTSLSGNTSNFDLISTPKLVISESPNKPLLAGKSLTFTSSFSCNSNLELSPIRPNETGPLLEPLTPGKVYKSGAINHHLSTSNYQNFHNGGHNNLNQLSSNLNALSESNENSNDVNFNSNSSHDSNSSTQNVDKESSSKSSSKSLSSTSSSSSFTPSSNSSSHNHSHSRSNSNHLPQVSLQPPIAVQQATQSSSSKANGASTTGITTSSSSTSHVHPHLKTPKSSGNTVRTTPMRVLRTPQNTSVKKLWNSPGYLDDFYYSPLITSQSALHSYDDDDMILRAFESPANNNFGHSRNHSHHRHPYYGSSLHPIHGVHHRRLNSNSSIDSKNLFHEKKLSSSVNVNDKLKEQ